MQAKHCDTDADEHGKENFSGGHLFFFRKEPIRVLMAVAQLMFCLRSFDIKRHCFRQSRTNTE